MATSPNDKLLGFEKHLLFKLCLYYSYGPDNTQDVASLFNSNYEGLRKVSAKQVKDAYLYMHDMEHDSYKLARDLNRKNPQQCRYFTKAEADDLQDSANTPFAVKNILKDELHFSADRLREPIIKPSKPMAGVRNVRCDNRKRKSRGGDPESVRQKTTLMGEGVPGGLRRTPEI